MIQFYKKRNFSELINDSFRFFKVYGKNYFKNYFLLNGILLIIMVALLVFGYREFFMQLFGSNVGGESYYFEEYFENNTGMLVVLVGLLFILGLAIAVVSYSFPVFYMKRLAETGETNITSDQILKDLKNNFGRIFRLFLGLIFIVTPAFVIIMLISYALILIVIGLFILILLMPASINTINFLLYDYLITKKGFFESLSYAVRAQFSYANSNEKSPFWKYWGTTFIIYLINYIVTMIFTMIPMIIFYAALFTVPGGSGSFESNPTEGAMGILVFVLYGFSFLVSLVLMNILMIASGLMYYDSRTDFHQKMDMLEIDSIGTNYEN
ncbi:MAG: DUF4013 domain-containing protein [Bergeyella sp.]